MIKRNLLINLKEWASKKNRKPLVIRGARQVGKTTLVKEFSKEFDKFIFLNLEKELDRKIFQDSDSVQNVMEILFLTRLGSNKTPNDRILIFIDEIQNSPKAIGFLRYFYEEYPDLFVITAGSRLQELFKTGVSFPVGRVEYLNMRPCFFNEFLEGKGLGELSHKLETLDISENLHSNLMELFQTYALTGGMPEILDLYYSTESISSLSPLYTSLLAGYDEDVEKYAKNIAQVNVLRHILRSGWSHAGQAITFNKFGESSFTSSTIHQAFELLEKAYIVNLDYPVSQSTLPVVQNLKRSPKLIWLDSGLVNFSAGIQVEYLLEKKLQDIWRGHAVEQIVGQELWKVLDRNYIPKQSYWIRDKRGSTAEIDFILPYQGRLIPIEVKSGTNSHLRSLQSFMHMPGASKLGIRIWSGELSINDVNILGTDETYRLINLPFYLTGEIDIVLQKYI